MNTRNGDHSIEVRGVPVSIVRKRIKNVCIGAHPPHGQVRVSVPLGAEEDVIRLAVMSRLNWIRRKCSEFVEQERQSLREFVSGESHYFEGRRYRMDVVEVDGLPCVSLLNNRGQVPMEETRQHLVAARSHHVLCRIAENPLCAPVPEQYSPIRGHSVCAHFRIGENLEYGD
ncbi:MAG: DUF45 domain-containing protein [Dehalococcoidia bacterium]|nr:DUF45 domain-containing protein [Dehalococcoidia bacterium]